MNKIALITGATSGIGRAVADIFAENKYNLIVTGRRSERLQELKAALEQQHGIGVLALCFDVRDNDEVVRNIESLPVEWRNIDVLVNNAGLAVGLNHIQDGVLDDWERMIDTNIKGLLYVTRAVSPLMVARNSGHIVNICSIAGKEVYENGNVYCATKHAVDALSKAMRIDMLGHNIKVTNVCPGRDRVFDSTFQRRYTACRRHIQRYRATHGTRYSRVHIFCRVVATARMYQRYDDNAYGSG